MQEVTCAKLLTSQVWHHYPSSYLRSDIWRMERNVSPYRPAVVICHSLPTNWMLPAPMGWAGAKCPPDPREHGFVYLIGRCAVTGVRLHAACGHACVVHEMLPLPMGWAGAKCPSDPQEHGFVYLIGRESLLHMGYMVVRARDGLVI